MNVLLPGGTMTNIGERMMSQLEQAPEQVRQAVAAKGVHP